MYETPNSFLPADIPYPSHTALRSTIESSVQALSAARKEHSRNGSSISIKGNGSATPPYVDTGVEEYKGSSPGEESASLKRKQLSPTSYSKNNSFGHTGTTVGEATSSGPLSTSKSRYTTLPPAFSDSISVPPPPPAGAGASSPCYDAPTPRSVYRPKHLTAMATSANQAGDYGSNQMDHLTSSVQSPELPPPPPESPMDSAHSTFSQAFFAQQQHQLNKSIDSDNMQGTFFFLYSSWFTLQKSCGLSSLSVLFTFFNFLTFLSEIHHFYHRRSGHTSRERHRHAYVHAATPRYSRLDGFYAELQQSSTARTACAECAVE